MSLQRSLLRALVVSERSLQRALEQDLQHAALSLRDRLDDDADDEELALAIAEEANTLELRSRGSIEAGRQQARDGAWKPVAAAIAVWWALSPPRRQTQRLDSALAARAARGLAAAWAGAMHNAARGEGSLRERLRQQGAAVRAAANRTAATESAAAFNHEIFTQTSAAAELAAAAAGAAAAAVASAVASATASAVASTAASGAQGGAPHLEWEWSAILDTRRCSTCAALHGLRVRTGQGFPGGFWPPVHPNCRCVVVPHGGPLQSAAAALPPPLPPPGGGSGGAGGGEPPGGGGSGRGGGGGGLPPRRPPWHTDGKPRPPGKLTADRDKHGRLVQAEPNERRTDQKLLREGNDVHIVQRTHNRSPDRKVNGEFVEIKTLSGTGENNCYSGIINKLKKGQAQGVIVDVTLNGLSEAEARSAARRAFDFVTATPEQANYHRGKIVRVYREASETDATTVFDFTVFIE